MSARIERAMVLAAGLGMRLRPITLTTPKPLVEVGGMTMLDRVLDRLAEHGVALAVVNTHHLGDQIARHVEARRTPRIVLSHEEVLLDTGGGVKKALPLLGDAPFFVANSDLLWTDGAEPALRRLAEAWDEGRMDTLLLLQPTARAYGYDGEGDFFLEPEGTLRRRAASAPAPYLFAGVQIVHPRLFHDAPDGKFSLNVQFDRAAAAGRLFGLVHKGGWYHVGTPDSLAGVEAALATDQMSGNTAPAG
jgi:N-acetyl-alpha-D-muramate 1-phosphate uridylyltransferase